MRRRASHIVSKGVHETRDLRYPYYCKVLGIAQERHHGHFNRTGIVRINQVSKQVNGSERGKRLRNGTPPGALSVSLNTIQFFQVRDYISENIVVKKGENRGSIILIVHM